MPEIQVFFTPMMVKEEPAGAGWAIQNLMSISRSVIARGKMAASGVQVDINILRPMSRGTVRLASGDPRDAPLIDPGYMLDQADIDDLVAGARHMREVMRQPAFEGILGKEISPGPEVTSVKDLVEAARNLVVTGHHPASTCRMGADNDPDAVLDAELRVRGVEGLRVVDASSFPDLMSGNTNAPAIMMAEKAADLILGRERLPPEDPRTVEASLERMTG